MASGWTGSRASRSWPSRSAALLALWIFVSHCLTAEEPFLNPRLLLDRNFAIGTLIAFVMGMLSFTSLVLFPSMLHDLRGYPDSVIGS